MGLVPRLFLIAHASTDAQRSARFPTDEPVSERGRRELARAEPPVVDRTLTAPELRAVATTVALGWSAVPTPALRDLGYGTWAGSEMDAVPGPELATWLTDPGAAPHGGESIAGLVARVDGWLRTLDGSSERVGAVTHPAVIRAATVCALGAPASAFWRIDVPPLSVTRLNGRDGRWTLRLG
jgi:broad specificity phosphatase PhoE